MHGLNWGPDGWLYFTMGNTWVNQTHQNQLRFTRHKFSDKTQYPLTKIYTKETYPKVSTLEQTRNGRWNFRRQTRWV